MKRSFFPGWVYWQARSVRREVERPEGQIVVVEAAVDRVPRQVPQGVVHPAHVPLEAEAQPAEVDGPGDPGPRGGLLRDLLHVRMALVDSRDAFKTPDDAVPRDGRMPHPWFRCRPLIRPFVAGLATAPRSLDSIARRLTAAARTRA